MKRKKIRISYVYICLIQGKKTKKKTKEREKNNNNKALTKKALEWVSYGKCHDFSSTNNALIPWHTDSPFSSASRHYYYYSNSLDHSSQQQSANSFRVPVNRVRR